jgi:lipopolysaccharide transport system permease protein
MTSQEITDSETKLPSRTSDRMTMLRPDRGLFDLELDQIWRFRGLLATLVHRDVMVMYRQAALGATWAIIQPIFAVAIFTIVFSRIAKLPVPGDTPYPIFAFAAVLPWTYFAEAVRRGSTGLVNESNLVRKVYFPRMIIPLSGVLAPLLDFTIAFFVLIAMMLLMGVTPTWRLAAAFPLVLVAGSMALAVSLWLAPINVRYRDIKYTMTFMLQIWMYASPVVYSSTMVPEKWKWVYALNPMVGVIEGFRWAVTGQGEPDMMALGIGASLIILLLFGGLLFFKRLERNFADLI